MTSLESIVLPLEQSRALVEHGIVLDTAMVWVRDPNTGDISVDARENRDVSLWSILCPTPVLSELLDAIRVKADAIEVKINRRTELERHEDDEQVCWELVGQGQGSCEDDWQQAVGKGTTDLLAACALLLEVAK